MRCGGRLVSDGDSFFDVRRICGDPDAVFQRIEYRTLRRRSPGACLERGFDPRCDERERTIEVVIDEWIYDLGPNKFIRYLTFEQGRLRDIQTGRYGGTR